MPVKIIGKPGSTKGKGSSCCTITGGTRHIDGMKLGPDLDNWESLSEDDLKGLCTTVKKFRHISAQNIDHLCAGKGGWAFEVFSSCLPMGVAFLHIRPPRKLDAVMGDGAINNVFSDKQLLAGYQSAKDGSRAPRVWRRNVDSWDEIAINFCLKHG